MSITANHEPPIRLADVPKLRWVAKRSRGRRPSVASVYRWARQGASGVRLEAVGAVTSEAALKRFFKAQEAVRRAAAPERPTQDQELWQ